MSPSLQVVVLGVAVSALCSSIHAGVTLYEGAAAFDGWWAAAGTPTAIDFTAFPQGTWMSDQYSNLGLTFTSSDPDVVQFDPSGFLLDGVGINGLSQVQMEFTSPTFAFGYHHPGIHGIQLWSGSSLLYASPALGQSGLFDFSGVTSTQPFDRVVLVPVNNPGVVRADNIYFSSVPAPGAISLVGFGSFMLGTRRRRIGC
jgi:hypothetical protein